MEYEDTFKIVYDFLRDKMGRVPKRRWSSVAKPVLQAINKAYQAILCIEEDPVKGNKHAAQTRYDAIVKAQYIMKEIEKPLWVYWNIAGDANEPEMKEQLKRQRINTIAQLNKVLELLHEQQTKSTKYDPENDHEKVIRLQYYTESEILNAQFLSMLRDLHRYTHGKIAKLNAIYRDAEGAVALDLIDDAWYYAVHGNKLHPADEAEGEERRKCFSKAISDLYKIQRPIFLLLSLGHYSNKEIKEWVGLVNESLRLLHAVTGAAFVSAVMCRRSWRCLRRTISTTISRMSAA